MSLEDNGQEIDKTTFVDFLENYKFLTVERQSQLGKFLISSLGEHLSNEGTLNPIKTNIGLITTMLGAMDQYREQGYGGYQDFKNHNRAILRSLSVCKLDEKLFDRAVAFRNNKDDQERDDGFENGIEDKFCLNAIKYNLGRKVANLLINNVNLYSDSESLPTLCNAIMDKNPNLNDMVMQIVSNNLDTLIIDDRLDKIIYSRFDKTDINKNQNDQLKFDDFDDVDANTNFKQKSLYGKVASDSIGYSRDKLQILKWIPELYSKLNNESPADIRKLKHIWEQQTDLVYEEKDAEYLIENLKESQQRNQADSNQSSPKYYDLLMTLLAKNPKLLPQYEALANSYLKEDIVNSSNLLKTQISLANRYSELQERFKAQISEHDRDEIAGTYLNNIELFQETNKPYGVIERAHGNINKKVNGFLIEFTDQLKDIAMAPPFNQTDNYSCLSLAKDMPDFMNQAHLLWNKMRSEKEKYSKSSDNNYDYIRGMFPDLVADLTKNMKENLLNQELKDAIIYFNKLDIGHQSAREYARQNGGGEIDGRIAYGLADAKVENIAHGIKTIKLFFLLNERPETYGSSLNEYSLDKIAKYSRINMPEWMYKIVMDNNNIDLQRLGSVKNLFDACKAWDINPNIWRKEATKIGKMPLWMRMTAGAVITKIENDNNYDLTKPVMVKAWNQNKELRNIFWIEMKKAQDMGRDAALQLYCGNDNSAANKGRLISIYFDDILDDFDKKRIAKLIDVRDLFKLDVDAFVENFEELAMYSDDEKKILRSAVVINSVFGDETSKYIKLFQDNNIDIVDWLPRGLSDEKYQSYGNFIKDKFCSLDTDEMKKYSDYGQNFAKMWGRLSANDEKADFQTLLGKIYNHETHVAIERSIRLAFVEQHKIITDMREIKKLDVMQKYNLMKELHKLDISDEDGESIIKVEDAKKTVQQLMSITSTEARQNIINNAASYDDASNELLIKAMVTESPLIDSSLRNIISENVNVLDVIDFDHENFIKNLQKINKYSSYYSNYEIIAALHADKIFAEGEFDKFMAETANMNKENRLSWIPQKLTAEKFASYKKHLNQNLYYQGLDGKQYMRDMAQMKALSGVWGKLTPQQEELSFERLLGITYQDKSVDRINMEYNQICSHFDEITKGNNKKRIRLRKGHINDVNLTENNSILQKFIISKHLYLYGSSINNDNTSQKLAETKAIFALPPREAIAKSYAKYMEYNANRTDGEVKKEMVDLIMGTRPDFNNFEREQLAKSPAEIIINFNISSYQKALNELLNREANDPKASDLFRKYHAAITGDSLQNTDEKINSLRAQYERHKDWMIPSALAINQTFGGEFRNYLNKIDNFNKYIDIQISKQKQTVIPAANHVYQNSDKLNVHDAVYWLPKDISAQNMPSFKDFVNQQFIYSDINGAKLHRDTSEMEIIQNNWDGLSVEETRLGYQEILAKCRSKKYINQRSETFACEASKFGVEERKYKEFEDIYFQGLGTPESFDSTKVFVKNNLRARFLPREDPRVGFFGQYTGCCQHFTGAGAKCAVSSIRDNHAQLFVIENEKKEIVAGSWVYKSKTSFDNPKAENAKSTYQVVTFDNIEAKQSYSSHDAEFFALYKEVSEYLVTEGNIRQVNIGCGGTDINIEKLSYTTVKHPLPLNYSGYSDASQQKTIASNPNAYPINEEAQQIYITGATQDDIPAMQNIAKICFPESDQNLMVPENDPQAKLLIDENKGVVGYILWDEQEKSIYDMAVLPEYRKDKNRSSLVLLNDMLKHVSKDGGEWSADLRDQTSLRYMRAMQGRNVIKMVEKGISHTMSDGSKVVSVTFQYIPEKDRNQVIKETATSINLQPQRRGMEM